MWSKDNPILWYKKKCCDVLAEFLKKEDYFSVEFDPNEIDIDKLSKA